MKAKTFLAGMLLSGAAVVGVNSSLYTVNECEQAVVTRLGKPIRVIVGNTVGQKDPRYTELVAWNAKEKQTADITNGPGLYWKVPFIDSVNIFEDRILEYDSAPTDVVTKNKHKVVIDNYARFRIRNPLKFMQTVLSERGAQNRLDDIVYSVVREQIGQYDLIEIVRTTNEPIETTEKREFEQIKQGREKVMDDITKICNEKAAEYGIEILDVRIKRADLPKENAASVYGRMTAERERIAKKYRSEGGEQEIKIKAETDLQKRVLMTEAYKRAEEIKGEGDAEALKIYAEAYSKNPTFFKLWRTLDGYEAAFDGKTKVILSSDTEFNKYLVKPRE